MFSILRTTWSDFVFPFLKRPARFQVAALCHRQHEGRTEILLITSRNNKRWVLPKGWPVRGYDAAGAAAAEAWEEAGVKPLRIGKTALGTYRYGKRMRGGVPVPCDVKVFPIEVESLADDFPQKTQRQRRWVTPAEAARMVDEPSLRAILSSLPSPIQA